MTIEEMVAELKAQNAAAEEKAQKAETEVASVKAELEEKSSKLDEANKSIEALDASHKSLKEEMENLKNEMKNSSPADFKRDFLAFLTEHKEELEKKMAGRDNFEVKSATLASAITNDYSLSVQPDPRVYAAPFANAFLRNFPIRPRTANKLSWIEAADTASVAYVAEGGTLSSQSSVAFEEKQRPYGKLATYVTISTEMNDWFNILYDYVVNEGTRIIENKLDDELWNGVGGTSGHTNEVYGLKGQSTAFSALAANEVVNATIADVICDSANQIAKEGFNADLAFVTWAEYATLQTIKDENGNYVFKDEVLRGIRVIPSNKLAAGEVFVCDSSCISVYAGNSFELEFIRNGAIDGWDVYYRKAAQTKVPTAFKKGLIYVSSLSTAIAALHKNGGVAAGVAKLASTVNSDNQIDVKQHQ